MLKCRYVDSIIAEDPKRASSLILNDEYFLEDIKIFLNINAAHHRNYSKAYKTIRLLQTRLEKGYVIPPRMLYLYGLRNSLYNHVYVEKLVFSAEYVFIY